MNNDAATPLSRMYILLAKLPELDRQAWHLVMEAILELPTGEQATFFSLARPIIELHLSRVASLQQLGHATTEQADRIRELMTINESLREELQSYQVKLSKLAEAVTPCDLSRQPEK